MEIIEIEQLEEQYLKESTKIIKTLIGEIKLREKWANLIINKKDEKISLLKEENTKLKVEISKINRDFFEIKNKLDKIDSNSYKKENIITGEMDEEEYIEIFDCCLQAFINEQYRVVKLCIKQIIENYQACKELMTIEHGITLLLIAFFQEEDERFRRVYNEFIDKQLKEYNIYKQLLIFRGHRNIETIECKSYMKDIKLDNIHYYIRDELREKICEYIELKTRCLEEKLNKQERPNSNVNILEENNTHRLYKIEQIVNDIEVAFQKSDTNALDRLFNYLLTNKTYYNKKLKKEQIPILLYVSYFQEYDQVFINEYKKIRQFMEINDTKLYNLLVNEKKKEGYKLTKECLIEYINDRQNNIDEFKNFKTNYVEKKMKEVAMPCIDKLYQKVGDRACIHSDENYISRWVWMWHIKMKRYVGFEALHCSKCNRYYISKMQIDKLNDYLAPHQISTINVMQLDQKNRYSGKENNLNDTSILKEMGYETAKTREERWRLLNDNIIPQIGKHKVVNHLKFLIRLNSAKSQMANAVSEWKYDLDRLEKFKS